MKLKQCTSLFLAVLLLVSNVGLAFNVHYCGGEIASVSSVFSSGEACRMQPVKVEKACCAKKIKIEQEKCCKDKVVNLQDKPDDVVVKIFSFYIEAPFIVRAWKPVVFHAAAIREKAPVPLFYADANAPPLFKLYSQYLFYA